MDKVGLFCLSWIFMGAIGAMVGILIRGKYNGNKK